MTAVEFLIDWMGKNQYFIGNDLLQIVEQAKKIENHQRQEKLKVQIAENESVLEMLRLHGNDSSIIRVFLRLESLKEQLKEMEL